MVWICRRRRVPVKNRTSFCRTQLFFEAPSMKPFCTYYAYSPVQVHKILKGQAFRIEVDQNDQLFSSFRRFFHWSNPARLHSVTSSMHSHSVETGHTCIIDSPGDKWNGFCLNCSANYVFLTHGADLDSRKAVAQMLSECFDSFSDEYNFEEVDRMMLQTFQSSVSSRDGVSDADIWNALQWMTDWRMPERLAARSDLLCDVMRSIVVQANRNNRTMGRTTRKEKCDLWWHFGLLRRCLQAPSQLPHAFCIQKTSCTGHNEALCKALCGAAGGTRGIVQTLQALIHRDNKEFAVHNVLEFADVVARLEGTEVITQLLVSENIATQSPSMQLPSPAQCLEAVDRLLRELTCDYTSILREATSTWHTDTNTSSSLAMNAYRSQMLQLIASLVSIAEAQGSVVQVLESFTAQVASRHRLHTLASSAVALLAQQVDNTASASNGVGKSVDYTAGLSCIMRLLRLQTPRNSVASLLLADDCNYSSKLFALYERSIQPPVSSGAPSTSSTHAGTVLLETLHALAVACPARYFHYSLFSQRVRHVLVQRYLHAVQQLTDQSAVVDTRPSLGRCSVGAGVGACVDSEAHCLMGLLLIAVQHRAVSGPTLLDLLQGCANLLTATSTSQPAMVFTAAVLAILTMLSNVLPLLSVAARTTSTASADTATDTAPIHSSTQAEVAAVHGTLQSAVLAALRSLALALQCAGDAILRTVHVQTNTAVLHCMRCCCLLGGEPTFREGGDALAVQQGCARLLSYTMHVLAEEAGVEQESAELFAAAVDLLQRPCARELCCKGFDSRLLHHRLAVYAALHYEASAVQVAYWEYLAALTSTVDGSNGVGAGVARSFVLLNLTAQSAGNPVTAARHCIKAIQPAVTAMEADCFIDLNTRPPDNKLTLLEQGALFYLSACLDSTGAALSFFVSPPFSPSGGPVDGAVCPGAAVLLALALAQYCDPVHICHCYPDAVRWALDCCNDAVSAVTLSAPLSAVLLTYSVLLMGGTAARLRSSERSDGVLVYSNAADPHTLLYYWSCCTADQEQPTKGVADKTIAAPSSTALLPLLVSRCTEKLTFCGPRDPSSLACMAEFVLATVRAAPIGAYTELMANALGELAGNHRPHERWVAAEPPEGVLWTILLVCATRLLNALHHQCQQSHLRQPEAKLDSVMADTSADISADAVDAAVRAVAVRVLTGLDQGHLLANDVTQSLRRLALSQCTWLWCRDIHTRLLHGEGLLASGFLYESYQNNEWIALVVQTQSMLGGGGQQRDNISATSVLYHLLVLQSCSNCARHGQAGLHATSEQALRAELRHQLCRGAASGEVAPSEQLFRDITTVSGALSRVTSASASTADAVLLHLLERVGLFCASTLAAAWLLVLPQRDATVPDSSVLGNVDNGTHDPLLRCWLLRAQELLLASDVALSAVTVSPPTLRTMPPGYSDVLAALRAQLRELHRCCALFCTVAKLLQELRTHPNNTSTLELHPCQSWLLLMTQQQCDPHYSEQVTALLSAAGAGENTNKFIEALLALVMERLLRTNENEVHLRYLLELV